MSLKSKYHGKQIVLEDKNVLETKLSRDQNVLGTKMSQGLKNVTGIIMSKGQKCSEAKNVL